jgi:hypothetical protein
LEFSIMEKSTKTATAVCRVNISTGEHYTEIHDWPAQLRVLDQSLLEAEGHLFQVGAQTVVLNGAEGSARFRLVEDVAELLAEELPTLEPYRTLRYVLETFEEKPGTS